MNKSELIALGVDEEVSKKIMAINGTDIESAKTKADKSQEIENLKSELKTTKETLEQANIQIKNFEGMDVEAKDKAIKEWETKFNDLEATAKAERETNEKTLKQQAYEFKLSEATGQLKFPNELTKKAFMNELKAKNLPLEGEKILGFEDYIKEMGEQNPGMFVVEEAPKQEPQLPQFTTQNTNQTTPPVENTNWFGWAPRK